MSTVALPFAKILGIKDIISEQLIEFREASILFKRLKRQLNRLTGLSIHLPVR